MKQNEEAQADQEDQEKWRKWRNSERSERSERSLGKINNRSKDCLIAIITLYYLNGPHPFTSLKHFNGYFCSTIDVRLKNTNSLYEFVLIADSYLLS